MSSFDPDGTAALPTGLTALTQTQLETWALQARLHTQAGQLPNYIPLLAKTDPTTFAIQVRRTDGAVFSVGDRGQSFPLMSVVKPFVLLFLLEQLGQESVFSRVGTDPSDQPFHSLSQLAADRGFPRNPMINSGAIALAGLLPGSDGAASCAALADWLNQQAGTQLHLDAAMLASVRSLGNEANRAIARRLKQTGSLSSVEATLDTYNHICCLSATVDDLTRLGLLLTQPCFASHARIVKALMLTCGLYEASGRYAVRIGVPIKSGVSGALLAVVPGQGAIACYSPTLDAAGNSVAGLVMLELLARSLKLSVFG